MKIIYINILIIFSGIIFANDSSSKLDDEVVRIDSIQITGNETTEAHIILRELNFSIGDTVSQSQLKFNQERVFSLGIFNKVDFDLHHNEDGDYNELEILVQESWYFYPLPYLDIKKNSIKKSTYGLILLYKNFRGRNESLFGLVTFGYDPTYMLQYFNPSLTDGGNLTFGLKLGYTNLQNRSILSQNYNGGTFDYNYIYGGVSFGYRINQFNLITHTTTYEYIDMPKSVSLLSASKENVDRIFSMGLDYEFDQRNLKQFSNNGIFAKSQITHKGFGINDISYNIFSLDIRKYNVVFENLYAKWRGLYRHTFGENIPFYALSLLGDDEFIRGHRFEKREGNNYLLTSLEFNYPIFKEWNLSLDLPLLPKKLTSARIGLYINCFIDSGTTYDNGKPLKLKSFDTGWGLGLTLLILPYNAFRFEYAFNEETRGEFILESGFSF